VTDVHAYMGALAVAVGCAWRDTLWWEVGVAGSARQAAWRSGWCALTAGFLVIYRLLNRYKWSDINYKTVPVRLSKE